MKVFINVLMFLAVLIQINARSITVAWYNLNKEYISKTLCVNRATPKSCCEGKCYLKKTLKAQEKQEQKLPSFLKDAVDLAFHFPESGFKLYLPVTEIKAIRNSFHIYRAYSRLPFPVFHPPS